MSNEFSLSRKRIDTALKVLVDCIDQSAKELPTFAEESVRRHTRGFITRYSDKCDIAQLKCCQELVPAGQGKKQAEALPEDFQTVEIVQFMHQMLIDSALLTEAGESTPLLRGFMSFLDLSGPYKLNNVLEGLEAVQLEKLDDINQTLENPYGAECQTVDELLNFLRASIPILTNPTHKAQYQDMATRGSVMTKNGLIATHPSKYHELPGWGISHGTKPAAGTIGAAYWSVIRLPLQFILQAMLTAYQDRGELKFFERSATICASLVEFVEVICKERVNCAKLALGVAVLKASSDSYTVNQELTSAAQLLAKECEKTSSQIKRIPEVNGFLSGLKRTHNSVKISSELVSGAGISAGGSGVSISNDFAGQAMTILSEGFEEYNATGSVSRTIGKVAGSFRR